MIAGQWIHAQGSGVGALQMGVVSPHYTGGGRRGGGEGYGVFTPCFPVYLYSETTLLLSLRVLLPFLRHRLAYFASTIATLSFQ